MLVCALGVPSVELGVHLRLVYPMPGEMIEEGATTGLEIRQLLCLGFHVPHQEVSASGLGIVERV